jgi:hypothetical protein
VISWSHFDLGDKGGSSEMFLWTHWWSMGHEFRKLWCRTTTKEFYIFLNSLCACCVCSIHSPTVIVEVRLEIKRIGKSQRCRLGKNYMNCSEIPAEKLQAVTECQILTNKLKNLLLTKNVMSSVLQLQTTAASWSYKSPTQATLLCTLSITSSEMCQIKQQIKTWKEGH